MNETIPSEDINFVPYTEVFPNTVIGGVEVDDNISSPTKTYSSEKIEDRLDETTESLTDAIDDAVSGIDLSNYQLTSDKDSRNGYLGFTNNVIVVDINFLQNNMVYSNPYLYNLTSSTGAGSYTSAGNSKTPKLRSGNDTQFRLPTLNLVGSATGNVTTALNGMTAMTLKSPYKALFEQTISYTNLGTKNNTFVIFAGDGARGVSTFTGSLLMFILNPLQNSGKWRVGKVVSGGTPAYANTDTSPTYNNSTKFSIYYNKSTEEALFYIDDVLVYTMTSVNLSDTTNFTLKMSLVREDSTETVSTYATPVRQTIIYDLR